MITETVIFWYFFCVRISGGRTVGWGIRVVVTVAYTTGLCHVASVVPLLANGYTHSAQLRLFRIAIFERLRSGWPGIRKPLVWAQTLCLNSLNSLHGLRMSDIRNQPAWPQTPS